MIFIFITIIVAVFALVYLNLGIITSNPDTLNMLKMVVGISFIIILPLSIRWYVGYIRRRKLKSLNLKKKKEKIVDKEAKNGVIDDTTGDVLSGGFDCISDSICYTDCFDADNCLDLGDIIGAFDCIDCDGLDFIDCGGLDCGDLVSGIDCGDCAGAVDCGDCASGIDCSGCA